MSLIATLAATALMSPSTEFVQRAGQVGVQTESYLSKQPKAGDEVAVIETDKGRIVVMFFPDVAPKHVENFKSLAKAGFYDGTRFHRCISEFMIQGGDPNTKSLDHPRTWGTGGHEVEGVKKTVPAEFNKVKHERGILSMARSSDPNSASSQFFIMHDTSPHLDGQYSVFGRAIEGLDVVDAIVKTGDVNNNGAVKPAEAVVLKSAKVVKWPLEKSK